MGAGRSGTTLLDIMLGNNPDVFSAGELNRFSKENGKPVNVEENSRTARFWNNFRTNLPGEIHSGMPGSLHRVCSMFEYHTGLIMSVLPFKTSSFGYYKTYISAFFNTLSSMVRQPVIVDSSKYPMRGYFMSQILKNEMVFIYVKRNPLDVVKSFEKKDVEQPSKSWLGSNLYLLVVNLICRFVLAKLRKNHKTITIYYHELISKPQDTLTRIGKELQIDVTESVRIAENGYSFKPGFLFDGNRIRLESEIFLSTSERKTQASGIKDQLTLFIQGLWWNKKIA